MQNITVFNLIYDIENICYLFASKFQVIPLPCSLFNLDGNKHHGFNRHTLTAADDPLRSLLRIPGALIFKFFSTFSLLFSSYNNNDDDDHNNHHHRRYVHHLYIMKTALICHRLLLINLDKFHRQCVWLPCSNYLMVKATKLCFNARMTLFLLAAKKEMVYFGPSATDATWCRVKRWSMKLSCELSVLVSLFLRHSNNF